MSAGRVIARQSVELLAAHLPAGGGRVLELGCGDGAVAAELQRRGFDVLALEPEESAVERARSRGVDARVAEWPDDAPDAGDFDAVVCVRSLHHMERLDTSVRRAREALRPGGVLLAVEFDRTPLDPVASAWVVGVIRILEAALPLEADPERFEGRLLSGEDPAAAWAGIHDRYHREFPTLVDMRRALGDGMDHVEEMRCATLYRYPARALPDVEGAGEITSRILRTERELLATGRVELPGRLLVARRS